MSHNQDVEALFCFIDSKKNNIYQGYRPAHMIKEGYLTTGVHSYYNLDRNLEEWKGTITFISPEDYPASLWIGKKIEMYEGSKMVGYATIVQIFNPILKSREYCMKELKYPSKETIYKLTQELKLKEANAFTQDWEYEVADVNQLAEYIEYYQSKNLNVNEKATLIRIILEAYNDDIRLENEENVYGETIKEFLKKDYSLYEETIKYWACEGEEPDNCFAITPFIRNIMTEYDKNI